MGRAETHHCHAVGCERNVPPRLLMCRRHWSLVPERDKQAVWRTYRRGQEQTMSPSPAYLHAAMEAVIAVAILEGRPEADILKASEVLGYWAWLQLLDAVPADAEPALSDATARLVPEPPATLDFSGDG